MMTSLLGHFAADARYYWRGFRLMPRRAFAIDAIGDAFILRRLFALRIFSRIMLVRYSDEPQISPTSRYCQAASSYRVRVTPFGRCSPDDGPISARQKMQD